MKFFYLQCANPVSIGTTDNPKKFDFSGLAYSGFLVPADGNVHRIAIYFAGQSTLNK